MNAFFIVPTASRGELFATHPPMEKRLARLAEIAREMGRPVLVASAAVGFLDVLFGAQAAPGGSTRRRPLRALDRAR